jgi:hypothetical protein
MQELYEFKVEKVLNDRTVVGALAHTGLRPTFLQKFERRGIELPASMAQNADGNGNGYQPGSTPRPTARDGVQ